VDFVAEALGLPFLPPFLRGGDFRRGANFAEARATALENEYYTRNRIKSVNTWNNSLEVQVDWFKHLHRSLRSVEGSNDSCMDLMSRSLFLVGEIGGNDYHHSMTDGENFGQIQKRVPDVIQRISSAIQVIVEHGARTILVPGNIPMGCQPILLTYYSDLGEDDYDPSTGCINWLNVFSEYHNELLRDELRRLRLRFPNTTIVYVDYYNAVMTMYRSPERFGFSKGLQACCGNGGGSYNYNSSCTCGSPGADLCSNPSRYISWDGVHLTEAAYKIIASGVLKGFHTSPRFAVSAGPCQLFDATVENNTPDIQSLVYS
jgi:phospholipase/lecithinase/hemolysin